MLTHYLNHQRLAGLRPESVATTARILTALQAHVGPDVPVERATRWHLESFLARDIAPATRKAYRSHLRGFYRWLLEEGIREDDPTLRLPAVKVPRGTPRPISDDELAVVLGTADRRMRAWLLLMALGGLRRCEVAALLPTDLLETPNGWLLHLRVTKGGGTATVPVHDELLAALAALPVYDGAWWDVNAETVGVRVARHLRASGVEATGHQLRHYAGTAWLRVSGYDLLTTARLLRHASVQTTQTYARVDPARPAEVARLVQLPRLTPVAPVPDPPLPSAA